MKKLRALLISAILAVTVSHAGENNNTLTLKTLNGKTIHIVGSDKGFTIPEYKGKILFVEFWGTHCPPCLMSIPHYIELTKKYKDQMAMLAVEVQATPKEQLKAFVQAKGINYDIVDYRSGYAFVEYITQRADWKGSIPLLLILDQQGAVQIIQPGLVPQEDLEKAIQEIIAKAKKPAAQKTTASTEANSSKK